MLAVNPYDGLYNAIVRRLRAAPTIFGQNVKLVLRQLSEEQWALLTLPYLLVVPTVTRVTGPSLKPQDNDYDSILNPRSVTFIAQLDGRGSEADWMAAIDIEIAEKQLISALVNWRPQPNYKPTAYAGMRVEATKAPAVKCAFVFTFFEELFVEADIDAELCEQLTGGCLELDRIIVTLQSCCPPPPLPPGMTTCDADPCDPDPCNPCAPGPQWTGTDLLSKRGDDQDDHQHDREGEKRGNRL